MNQEESIRCLQISKTKYSDGDITGAIKFIKKSISLHTTADATKYLDFLLQKQSENSKETFTPKPSKSPPKPHKPQQQEAKNRKFTQSQVDEISRIKKKKGDFYGVLGLDKNCSDSDIKKAYRRLALKFHPDKCSAPGTDEAFKSISHSFTVLSDPDKRAVKK